MTYQLSLDDDGIAWTIITCPIIKGITMHGLHTTVNLFQMKKHQIKTCNT